MRKFILIVLIFCSCFALKAQKYNTAAGVRISKVNENNSIGFTINQRITTHIFLEGIYENTESQFEDNEGKQQIVSLLAKYHKPILTFKKLNLYAGAGIAFNLAEVEVQDFNYAYVGIIGAEIQIPILPVIASFDYKPAIANVQDEPLNFDNTAFGVSLRWILGSDKKKKERLKKQKKNIRNDKLKDAVEDIKDKVIK